MASVGHSLGGTQSAGHNSGMSHLLQPTFPVNGSQLQATAFNGSNPLHQAATKAVLTREMQFARLSSACRAFAVTHEAMEAARSGSMPANQESIRKNLRKIRAAVEEGVDALRSASLSTVEAIASWQLAVTEEQAAAAKAGQQRQGASGRADASGQRSAMQQSMDQGPGSSTGVMPGQAAGATVPVFDWNGTNYLLQLTVDSSFMLSASRVPTEAWLGVVHEGNPLLAPLTVIDDRDILSPELVSSAAAILESQRSMAGSRPLALFPSATANMNLPGLEGHGHGHGHGHGAGMGAGAGAAAGQGSSGYGYGSSRTGSRSGARPGTRQSQGGRVVSGPLAGGNYVPMGFGALANLGPALYALPGQLPDTRAGRQGDGTEQRAKSASYRSGAGRAGTSGQRGGSVGSGGSRPATRQSDTGHRGHTSGGQRPQTQSLAPLSSFQQYHNLQQHQQQRSISPEGGANQHHGMGLPQAGVAAGGSVASVPSSVGMAPSVGHLNDANMSAGGAPGGWAGSAYGGANGAPVQGWQSAQHSQVGRYQSYGAALSPYAQPQTMASSGSQMGSRQGARPRSQGAGSYGRPLSLPESASHLDMSDIHRLRAAHRHVLRAAEEASYVYANANARRIVDGGAAPGQGQGVSHAGVGQRPWTTGASGSPNQGQRAGFRPQDRLDATAGRELAASPIGFDASAWNVDPSSASVIGQVGSAGVYVPGNGGQVPRGPSGAVSRATTSYGSNLDALATAGASHMERYTSPRHALVPTDLRASPSAFLPAGRAALAVQAAVSPTKVAQLDHTQGRVLPVRTSSGVDSSGSMVYGHGSLSVTVPALSGPSVSGPGVGSVAGHGHSSSNSSGGVAYPSGAASSAAASGPSVSAASAAVSAMATGSIQEQLGALRQQLRTPRPDAPAEERRLYYLRLLGLEGSGGDGPAALTGSRPGTRPGTSHFGGGRPGTSGNMGLGSTASVSSNAGQAGLQVDSDPEPAVPIAAPIVAEVSSLESTLAHAAVALSLEPYLDHDTRTWTTKVAGGSSGAGAASDVHPAGGSAGQSSVPHFLTAPAGLTHIRTPTSGRPQDAWDSTGQGHAQHQQQQPQPQQHQLDSTSMDDVLDTLKGQRDIATRPAPVGAASTAAAPVSPAPSAAAAAAASAHVRHELTVPVEQPIAAQSAASPATVPQAQQPTAPPATAAVAPVSPARPQQAKQQVGTPAATAAAAPAAVPIPAPSPARPAAAASPAKDTAPGPASAAAAAPVAPVNQAVASPAKAVAAPPAADISSPASRAAVAHAPADQATQGPAAGASPAGPSAPSTPQKPGVVEPAVQPVAAETYATPAASPAKPAPPSPAQPTPAEFSLAPPFAVNADSGKDMAAATQPKSSSADNAGSAASAGGAAAAGTAGQQKPAAPGGSGDGAKAFMAVQRLVRQLLARKRTVGLRRLRQLAAKSVQLSAAVTPQRVSAFSGAIHALCQLHNKQLATGEASSSAPAVLEALRPLVAVARAVLVLIGPGSWRIAGLPTVMRLYAEPLAATEAVCKSLEDAAVAASSKSFGNTYPAISMGSVNPVGYLRVPLATTHDGAPKTGSVDISAIVSQSSLKGPAALAAAVAGVPMRLPAETLAGILNSEAGSWASGRVKQLATQVVQPGQGLLISPPAMMAAGTLLGDASVVGLPAALTTAGKIAAGTGADVGGASAVLAAHTSAAARQAALVLQTWASVMCRIVELTSTCAPATFTSDVKRRMLELSSADEENIKLDVATGLMSTMDGVLGSPSSLGSGEHFGGAHDNGGAATARGVLTHAPLLSSLGALLGRMAIIVVNTDVPMSCTKGLVEELLCNSTPEGGAYGPLTSLFDVDQGNEYMLVPSSSGGAGLGAIGGALSPTAAPKAGVSSSLSASSAGLAQSNVPGVQAPGMSPEPVQRKAVSKTGVSAAVAAGTTKAVRRVSIVADPHSGAAATGGATVGSAAGETLSGVTRGSVGYHKRLTQRIVSAAVGGRSVVLRVCLGSGRASRHRTMSFLSDVTKTVATVADAHVIVLNGGFTFFAADNAHGHGHGHAAQAAQAPTPVPATIAMPLDPCLANTPTHVACQDALLLHDPAALTSVRTLTNAGLTSRGETDLPPSSAAVAKHHPLDDTGRAIAATALHSHAVEAAVPSTLLAPIAEAWTSETPAHVSQTRVKEIVKALRAGAPPGSARHSDIKSLDSSKLGISAVSNTGSSSSESAAGHSSRHHGSSSSESAAGHSSRHHHEDGHSPFVAGHRHLDGVIEDDDEDGTLDDDDEDDAVEAMAEAEAEALRQVTLVAQPEPAPGAGTGLGRAPRLISAPSRKATMILNSFGPRLEIGMLHAEELQTPARLSSVSDALSLACAHRAAVIAAAFAQSAGPVAVSEGSGEDAGLFRYTAATDRGTRDSTHEEAVNLMATSGTAGTVSSNLDVALVYSPRLSPLDAALRCTAGVSLGAAVGGMTTYRGGVQAGSGGSSVFNAGSDMGQFGGRNAPDNEVLHVALVLTCLLSSAGNNAGPSARRASEVGMASPDKGMASPPPCLPPSGPSIGAGAAAAASATPAVGVTRALAWELARRLLMLPPARLARRLSAALPVLTSQAGPVLHKLSTWVRDLGIQWSPTATGCSPLRPSPLVRLRAGPTATARLVAGSPTITLLAHWCAAVVAHLACVSAQGGPGPRLATAAVGEHVNLRSIVHVGSEPPKSAAAGSQGAGSAYVNLGTGGGAGAAPNRRRSIRGPNGLPIGGPGSALPPRQVAAAEILQDAFTAVTTSSGSSGGVESQLSGEGAVAAPGTGAHPKPVHESVALGASEAAGQVQGAMLGMLHVASAPASLRVVRAVNVDGDRKPRASTEPSTATVPSVVHVFAVPGEHHLHVLADIIAVEPKDASEDAATGGALAAAAVATAGPGSSACRFGGGPHMVQRWLDVSVDRPQAETFLSTLKLQGPTAAAEALAAGLLICSHSTVGLQRPVTPRGGRDAAGAAATPSVPPRPLLHPQGVFLALE